MEDTGENAELIEAMVKEAKVAEEPGEIARERIIHTGDADMPAPMVATKVESAGYTWVYDTKTGIDSKINNNNLRNVLKKKREDGSYVFSLKQVVKPVKYTHKCLLHKSDPNRAHYDELGFATCPKDNLSAPFHVKRHMQKRHKVEFEAIEQERIDKERKEDRELQRVLIEKATEKAPLYVKDKEKVTK